jgi:hypothetical protein
MENQLEIIETQEQVSSDVIYQQDKAAIDVQITTAKAYPRNIKRSTDNALAIVTIDQETAKTCTYSVPRGGKAITGPSVHLAKILAQVWGNLRCEAKVVLIDSRQITSEAICFDLENNLAIKTQVKRSIMGKSGRFNDDMITVTGNAANSIALRNAILSVIPRAIVDKVYNASKQVITGDVSDKNKLIAKRTQVFTALKDAYEITDKEILSAIGKAAIDHVTPDDLVVLIGIGTAIKDGDTTVDYAFRGKRDISPIQPSTAEKEKERIMLLIADCKDLKSLKKLDKQLNREDAEMVAAYTNKADELSETDLKMEV